MKINTSECIHRPMLWTGSLTIKTKNVSTHFLYYKCSNNFFSGQFLLFDVFPQTNTQDSTVTTAYMCFLPDIPDSNSAQPPSFPGWIPTWRPWLLVAWHVWPEKPSLLTSLLDNLSKGTLRNNWRESTQIWKMDWVIFLQCLTGQVTRHLGLCSQQDRAAALKKEILLSPTSWTLGIYSGRLLI